MYFKDVAYALVENTGYDSKKRPVKNYTKSLFYCNEKKVGTIEFYQAGALGFKPEVKLETKDLDLNKVTHIKYNEKYYKILRSSTEDGLTTLVLSSPVIDISLEVTNHE